MSRSECFTQPRNTSSIWTHSQVTSFLKEKRTLLHPKKRHNGVQHDQLDRVEDVYLDTVDEWAHLGTSHHSPYKVWHRSQGMAQSEVRRYDDLSKVNQEPKAESEWSTHLPTSQAQVSFHSVGNRRQGYPSDTWRCSRLQRDPMVMPGSGLSPSRCCRLQHPAWPLS